MKSIKISPNFILILLCTLFFGCTQLEKFDPVKAYALELSTTNIPVAKRVIINVNQLLGVEELYFFENELKGTGTAILWVDKGYLSETIADMMFVLRDCRCIVIQSAVFEDWILKYGTVGQLEESGILSATDVMNYFVLHELGHIEHGHVGRALNNTKDNFNRLDSVEKQQETQADEYAASIIQLNSFKSDDFNIWMVANGIKSKLANLAFDLQGIRVTENFACSATDAPCAFHDMGHTHPNLELRILRVNCMLEEKSCDLLRDFEDRRNSGGTFGNDPIYISDDLTLSL